MTSIFHQQFGTGKPLVFLHGFCETNEIWYQLKPLLSHNLRAFFPDLAGFGKSEVLKEPFAIEDVAGQMWTWLETIKVEKPILIGHSLGGYVALAMGRQRPGLVSGIGLFHSTALEDTPEKKENRNKVIEFIAKHGVDPFLDTFVSSLFYKKDHPDLPTINKICRQTKKDTVIAYTRAMRDRPDQLPFLKDFNGPILFLGGSEDTFVTPESLISQSKMAKNGVFECISGVGHLGMIEDPIASARIVNGFAKKVFALDLF